jgi:hypothetical protein
MLSLRAGYIVYLEGMKVSSNTTFVLAHLIKASKFESQVKEVGRRKLDEHHGGKVMLCPLFNFSGWFVLSLLLVNG